MAAAAGLTEGSCVGDELALSPYRQRFAQGATLVPSVLVRVKRVSAGPLGTPAGTSAIESARSPLEKLPWKALPAQRGVVEERFLHPMHAGATIGPYVAFPAELVVIPHDENGLLEAASDEIDGYPGFAAWWQAAERLWRRGDTRKMTLTQRQDFQQGLRRQFPLAKHRVVYSASGTHLAACRLEGSNAVLEHKLYWAATDGIDEVRYLTAILNSTVLARAVEPPQSRGDFGPRDFDLYVFALGFPAFDSTDATHKTLVDLAATAESVAATTPLESAWGFQRKRRAIRDGLTEHWNGPGVAGEIDSAVTHLLLDTAPPEAVKALAT